jgi:hypothetical protein
LRTLVASLLASAAPLTAAAQSAAATSSQATQGPMIVERVRSGFIVAPDFKVTNVDHTTSELAGAYGGWINDGRLFVGAGGYWLTNRRSDRQLWYGGLVVGWLARTDRRFGFGAKALVGGGEATLGSTITTTVFEEPERRRLPATTRVRFRDDVFVVEPEGTVFMTLGHGLRLTGGVGYRLIAAARGSENRLRGVSGSIALQISGGS